MARTKQTGRVNDVVPDGPSQHVEAQIGVSELQAAVTIANTGLVRNLYQYKCESRCCPTRWSQFPSHKEDQDYLDKENNKTPILHRHVYDNDAKDWITRSFTVQCSIMKRLIRKALEGYQDLDMDLENWKFIPPFRPLIHQWDKLNDIKNRLTESAEVEAANTLVEFLTPVLEASIASLKQTRETGKVSFENIWQIFPPGSLALTKLYGIETIGRTTKYEFVPEDYSQKAHWTITVEIVEWTGEKCGYTTLNKTITLFDGFKHVKDLPVFSLEFDENAHRKRKMMLERGRRFESWRGYHHLACEDNAKKVVSVGGCQQLKPTSGRVVIDAFAFFRCNNIVRPELTPLIKPINRSAKTIEDDDVESVDGEEDDEDDDEGDDEDEGESKGSSQDYDDLTMTANNKATIRIEDLTPLTDEQCIISTPWLRGMDLKTREWGQFFIDELHEIAWNEKAFDNLVLPEEDKSLTWDFVEARGVASENSFDDFIADKGKGTIILMFGPPGVGKTYTAEAVAEKARVPLYCMSAGVLGTTPNEVETALEEALDLCRLWNAVLLLDEADVFLSARTDEALLRNELVSIFLTKLEYYQGILFLTTNRIANIDHAFQSRIDLFLPYYNLSTEARKQIWKNFIDRGSNFTISDADLNKLSEITLNGREIKNLIKSAQLLSLKKDGNVTVSSLLMLAEKRAKALALLSA